MANIYVRSGAGGTPDGTTWATAWLTLAAALTGGATSADTIWLANDHAESTTGSVTYSFPTTAGLRVICVGTNTVNPPTATEGVATSATVTYSTFIVFKGQAYFYGVSFISTGSSVTTSNDIGSKQTLAFDSCLIRCGGVGITIGSNASNVSQYITLKNQKFSGANVAHQVRLVGTVRISGGSIDSGSAALTQPFVQSTDRTHSELVVDAFDFTNGASTLTVFTTAGAGNVSAVFRNCKLPASWTGSLTNTVAGVGQRVSMYNSDSGDTNYKVWVSDYYGTIRDESTVVRTGGAVGGQYSGGTALSAFSWKVSTNANSFYPYGALSTDEIVRWNETTGSSLTATVEILHFAQGTGTNSGVKNDAVWLEIQHLGTTGYPLSLFASDAAANVLATAVTQDTSTESWDGAATAYSAATNYVVGDIVKPSTPNGALYICTVDAGTTAAEPTWGTTDGGTTADAAGRTWVRSNRQKLVTTFTPQEKGFIHAVVRLAKASTTVYVDPKLTVA